VDNGGMLKGDLHALRLEMQRLLSKRNRSWESAAMQHLAQTLLSAANNEPPRELNAGTVANSPTPEGSSDTDPHPAVKYLRRISVWSLFLGVARLIPNPSFYWWQTGFIYAAGLSFLVDLWFEQWKKKYKVLAVAMVLALGLLFTLGTVWVSAPLESVAFASLATYPKGATKAGIQWETAFTELTVTISNGSKDRDYDSVDVLLKPDQPVVHIAQLSNVPGVYFKHAESSHFSAELVEQSKRQADQANLLASTSGYRVICPRLPAGISLEIVMARARPSGKKGFAVTLSNGDTFWMRDDLSDSTFPSIDYFSDRVVAKNVVIVGQYTDAVAQRRRSVSEHLVALDVIGGAFGGKER
jgi:hypothetical protein